MARDYQKRDSKEYNIFRGIFQWITCTLVYGLFYHVVFGLKIEGRFNVPKNKFFIAASNHVSAIDPFLVIHALQRNVAYMAKVELFQNKIASFFLDLLGAFAVDRAKLSVSTIKTVKGLKNTKWCLGIFPQGTRELSGNMDNINKGFASFAKSLKCDILPIGIIGVSREERKPFKTKMTIRIGKPIPYNDNIDEMIELWSKKVKELSDENIPFEEIDKEVKQKKERNYAQRHAREFNFLTRLYQFYSLYVVFLPFFGIPFYKLIYTKNKNLEKKQYIVAPNHISYMDVFIVNHALGRPLAYMAKQELFKTGDWKKDYITRNILRLGAFAVNRGKVSLSTIRTVKEVFKTKFNLCIFPQGGIRKNKTIENINEGFIYFAKANKKDILPMGVSGLESYNWNIFKKQKVHVKIGVPISYELPDDEIIKQWAAQIEELTGYTNLYK